MGVPDRIKPEGGSGHLRVISYAADFIWQIVLGLPSEPNRSLYQYIPSTRSATADGATSGIEVRDTQKSNSDRTKTNLAVSFAPQERHTINSSQGKEKNKKKKSERREGKKIKTRKRG